MLLLTQPHSVTRTLPKPPPPPPYHLSAPLAFLYVAAPLQNPSARLIPSPPHVFTCDLLCSPLTPCLSLSSSPAVPAREGLETTGGRERGGGGALGGSPQEGSQGPGGAAGAPGGAARQSDSPGDRA